MSRLVRRRPVDLARPRRPRPSCRTPSPTTAGRGRTGVLLCHGFSGSPQSMRPWAEHLEADGFRVTLPRLPGHGTTWQELNQTPVGGLVRLRRPGVRRPAGPSATGCSARLCRWAAVWPSGSPSSTGTRSPDSPWSTPSIGSADPRYRLLPWLRHVWPSLAGSGSATSRYPTFWRGRYDRAAARWILGDQDGPTSSSTWIGSPNRCWSSSRAGPGGRPAVAEADRGAGGVDGRDRWCGWSAATM